MSLPTVSIITPAWRRPDLLLNRGIPGVDVQTYPGTIEHVITSDGPDPELAAKLFPPLVTKRLKRWYTSLPVHEEGLHWGHLARLHAIPGRPLSAFEAQEGECAFAARCGYEQDACRAAPPNTAAG